MAKMFKNTLSMVMILCMLISMLPVQALAEENEAFQTGDVEGTLTVEGNTIIVEFSPAEGSETPEGDLEWESNLTLGENVDTTVTDVNVTEEETEGSTVVTESATVETEGTLEDDKKVEGEETYTETTTIEEDSTTVQSVLEGEETVTGPVEEVAPGEEVPAVDVPIPNGDEINVEENSEGEPVVEEDEENGTVITTQTTETVEETENEDGSTTTTETITTTETVKPAEGTEPEDGKSTETTTETTIEKTTTETVDENGEEVTEEELTVNVHVTEVTTEVTGDVKEGEDDPEYDFTETETTVIRDVTVESTDNGVSLEDASTGLVGEQETELTGRFPVYDEIDGVREDKYGMRDNEFMKSAVLDFVEIDGVIIWVGDHDGNKVVSGVCVPEGTTIPEGFAYEAGMNVNDWYKQSNGKLTTDPIAANLPEGAVATNNVEAADLKTWYRDVNQDGVLQDDELIVEIPEGADFRYVGVGEHAQYYIARLNVAYKKDGNETLRDENGNPIIDYLYTDQGSKVTIEYDDGISGNGVPATEIVDGDLYSALTGIQPATFMMMDKNGNVVATYCADMGVNALDGSWYSVSNLEDSDYYPSEDSKDHIRAIMMNGYWGTSDIPQDDGTYNPGSLEAIKESLKAAIENGEVDRYFEIWIHKQNGKLDYDDNDEIKTQTVDMLEIIDGLTEGEAMLATQAAVWSYSDGHQGVLGGEDGEVVVDASSRANFNISYFQNGLTDHLDNDGGARVDFLYNWLMNLEPEEEEMPIVIDDVNFVEDMTLTVHEKVDDEEIVENYDDDDTNDVYNTDLNFRLSFIPGAKDDLLVQITYNDLDGSLVNVTRRLAGKNAEGQNYEMIYPEEGTDSYVLRGLRLSENNDVTFDLRLEGTQYLGEDVYVYAPVVGREMSQTMVGIAEGTHNVDVSASMIISFNVDESQQVVAVRQWREEIDPVFPEEEPDDPTPPEYFRLPPQTTAEEPAPRVRYRMTRSVGQLETIMDEEVPLAEVPQTGDTSILWFALTLLSVCGLCILRMSEKKRMVHA